MCIYSIGKLGKGANVWSEHSLSFLNVRLPEIQLRLFPCIQGHVYFASFILASYLFIICSGFSNCTCCFMCFIRQDLVARLFSILCCNFLPRAPQEK